MIEMRGIDRGSKLIKTYQGLWTKNPNRINTAGNAGAIDEMLGVLNNLLYGKKTVAVSFFGLLTS
jgi:hypothetical protein